MKRQRSKFVGYTYAELQDKIIDLERRNNELLLAIKQAKKHLDYWGLYEHAGVDLEAILMKAIDNNAEHYLKSAKQP